jgi:hypothetical protein
MGTGRLDYQVKALMGERDTTALQAKPYRGLRPSPSSCAEERIRRRQAELEQQQRRSGDRASLARPVGGRIGLYVTREALAGKPKKLGLGPGLDRALIYGQASRKARNWNAVV